MDVFSIGPGESSYTAESFWRLCAAIVENKIDPNPDGPPANEDDEGFSVARKTKKMLTPRDVDGFVEVGYTAYGGEESFTVDVRMFAVSSQNEIDGKFEPQYMFSFFQHDGEQLEVELWFHKMWIKVHKAIPNYVIRSHYSVG